MATDPDEAYLPPGGMARLVHADLPTMLIGGVSALLLQTLHPLAMAGVAEHSGYKEDPLGRLRRTATFVGTTTFGTTAQAEAAIAQVHRVHRRVRGRRPTAGPTRRTTPSWSPSSTSPRSRASWRRHGATAPVRSGPSSATATTRRSPPWRSPWGDLGPPLGGGGGELPAPGPARALRRAAGREARDWLLRDVARRPGERAVYSLVLASAIGILPAWARRELRLSLAGPIDLLVDTAAVGPLTRGLSAAVRWMVTPPA